MSEVDVLNEFWRAWLAYCREPKNKWDFLDQLRAGLIMAGTGVAAYQLLVVLTARY